MDSTIIQLTSNFPSTQPNFNYDSELWNNTDDFNPKGGETGFDLNETKLPTYWKIGRAHV